LPFSRTLDSLSSLTSQTKLHPQPNVPMSAFVFLQ
jgi:hypothetical protein